MKLVSYVERPDLLERRDELGAAWDEFMYHDAVANVHWNRQYEEFPDLQLFLLDEDDRLLAESNAVPIPFGPDELPDDGWDAALEQAFAGRPATAVSAIAITIGVDQRGKGLSRTMLDGMRDAVAARGLSDLVAPVRPSQKHAYPLTPMERYVEWRRDDGKLHRRLAAHPRAGGRRADRGRADVDADLGLRLGLGELDRACGSRTAAHTSFPARSSRSRSIASATRASTSSRTSGCTTASRQEAARARRPARPGRRAGASRPLRGRGSSSGCASAATRRSSAARRCRNDPSNRDCFRSGS